MFVGDVYRTHVVGNGDGLRQSKLGSVGVELVDEDGNFTRDDEDLMVVCDSALIRVLASSQADELVLLIHSCPRVSFEHADTLLRVGCDEPLIIAGECSTETTRDPFIS